MLRWLALIKHYWHTEDWTRDGIISAATPEWICFDPFTRYRSWRFLIIHVAKTQDLHYWPKKNQTTWSLYMYKSLYQIWMRMLNEHESCRRQPPPIAEQSKTMVRVKPDISSRFSVTCRPTIIFNLENMAHKKITLSFIIKINFK